MKPLRHRLLPSRSVLGVLIFTLAVVCLGSFARAQATSAQVGGRVIDQTGAVVQNATIVVLNVGTGLERTVSTSSLGEYVIPSLPVGTYKLTTAAASRKWELRIPFTSVYTTKKKTNVEQKQLSAYLAMSQLIP